MDLTKLYNLLKGLEDFDSRENGASTKEIIKLETALDVKLPNDYLEFLKIFGYVSSFEIDIFGISDDKNEDATYQTIKARNEELPDDFAKLPLDGIVFRDYGGSGHYFLYSQDSPRSGEVSLILHENFNKEESKWDSFFDYLEFTLDIEVAEF